MSDTLEHGKLGTYTNHGCRCPECREANAAYHRERYQTNHKGFRDKKLKREAAERRRKRIAASDHHHYDEKLTVEPMRQVLIKEVNSIGIGNVASACRVHARRISAIIDGYYYSNLTDGTSKRYPYKWITFRIADEWCTALGHDIKDVYDKQYWRPRPPVS